MRSSNLVALAVAVLLLEPGSADACIHVGGAGASEVPITQKGQQVFLVYHEGREHLILKVEYEASGDVPSLGMIVPVPSVPEDYGTADEALFGELGDWVNLHVRRPALRSGGLRARNGDPPAASSPPLVALEPATVGPYRIQPLQTSGPAGVEALQTWMEDNAFTPLPTEALTYFSDRQWTFLAVKIEPPDGGTLGRAGGLPPLRVSFDYDRPVVPLKLEAQGVFPMRLYVVTSEELPNDALAGARQRGFTVAGGPGSSAQMQVDVGRFTPSDAPEAVAALLGELVGPTTPLFMRVLFQRRFGQGRGAPADWEEDLSLSSDSGRLEGTPIEPEPDPEPEPEPEPASTEASGPTPVAAEAPAATQDGGCDSCAVSTTPTYAHLGWLPLLAAAWRRRRGARGSRS